MMTNNLEHGWIVDGIDNDDGPDVVHCCECYKELTDGEYTYLGVGRYICKNCKGD